MLLFMSANDKDRMMPRRVRRQNKVHRDYNILCTESYEKDLNLNNKKNSNNNENITESARTRMTLGAIITHFYLQHWFWLFRTLSVCVFTNNTAHSFSCSKC